MTKLTLFSAQRVGLACVLLLLVQPSDASAQAPPDDIFGSPSTPAPAPAADVFGPATPAGESTPVETAGGAPADPDAIPPAALPETDPAVLAVQESEPTTPAELLWAVETLLNLERPELAKQYLEQLQASQASDEELVAAQRRFRTPLLLRIARDARLQPAGRAVVQRLVEAAQSAQEDVARVGERVQMLQDADPAARHAALVDLRQLGAPGAAGILQALARATEASQRDRFRAALAEFGPEAIGPLTAAIRAGDARLRSDAIAALGGIGALETAVSLVRPSLDAGEPAEVRQAARKAMRQLVGVLPTLDEARIYLRRQAEARLNKSAQAVDPLEAADVWQWSAADQQLARQRTQRSAAAMAEAAAIARDLVTLFQDDKDARQLYLLTQLQLAKLTEEDSSAASREYRAQLEDFARGFGSDALESVLARALADGFLPAAQGAVELLGEVGTSELLASIDGKPRPLVQALDHPLPALRRAASRAIVQIDPTSPYAGSSRLPDWLAYFARTSGERRVLVAHPNDVQGLRIAGLFAGLGLQGEAVQTGEELFERLRLRPDYELALISRAIQKPDAHHLLQIMRQDAHAATLPIGLLVDGADDDRVRNWAEDDPRLRLVLTPVDSEHLTLQLGSLWPLNIHAISREQRFADAQLALQTFARWAEHERAYDFYNVMSYEPTVEQALFVPELAAAAATVLGYFGTPSAQQALVDFASDTSQDLAARQTAAQAFAVAVGRRGLLLTTAQIAQQYDRYHAGASLDQPTQQVLGSLLETIERPTQGQVASKTQEAQP